MNTGWVMWLVMGLLVGVMIFFLGFSYYRDKKKNKIIIYKKIELKNITEKTSKEISLRINTIVEVNHEKVEKFVPSIGELTMKEINTISKDLLKDIYKSNLFKKIYLAEDYDPQFADNLKSLIDQKSNHWNKKCAKELEYFKNLENELKETEQYSQMKTEILEKVNEKFNKNARNVTKNDAPDEQIANTMEVNESTK
ncbi:MAG: MHJ_0274 family protein [Metamycoplasmataceae bacterium]